MSGITPAHAGKSFHPDFLKSIKKDHPRTRGEKAKGIKQILWKQGSPPHTRGKVMTLLDVIITPRITPAHAGKSVSSTSWLEYGGDHPRTRGDKERVLVYALLLLGSPPHTRGKVSQTVCADTEDRDHPRTRGEKLILNSKFVQWLGSPPHTRGKATASTQPTAKVRITPAHAGKRLNKPPYYGHSSAAGHRISFNFPMSSYVSRQSVKALCAPRISIPKYSQSAVSVY